MPAPPANTRPALVVEDEPDIARIISHSLGREGFAVTVASRADEGLRLVQERKPDIIILDLMLPGGMDGLEFCKQLRYRLGHNDIPVVMVTARAEEADIVTGLEVGADDYVTKPFSPRVLMARVKAVLRRRARTTAATRQEPPRPTEVVEAHGLWLHPGRLEAKLKGGALELTHSEFLVLHFLARNPGWVYTRREIVEGIRGDRYPVTERSVDVLILGLRRKLGDAGDLVETVRATGYRFRAL